MDSRYRSSRPEVFCKKGVLRNFAKFTGKHLCQSLFFNKVAGLRPSKREKKTLWHRCFPVNFAKFLRTPFIVEHLWWLLLKIVQKPVFMLSKNLLFGSSHNLNEADRCLQRDIASYISLVSFMVL